MVCGGKSLGWEPDAPFGFPAFLILGRSPFLSLSFSIYKMLVSPHISILALSLIKKILVLKTIV